MEAYNVCLVKKTEHRVLIRCPIFCFYNAQPFAFYREILQPPCHSHKDSISEGIQREGRSKRVREPDRFCFSDNCFCRRKQGTEKRRMGEKRIGEWGKRRSGAKRSNESKRRKGYYGTRGMKPAAPSIRLHPYGVQDHLHAIIDRPSAPTGQSPSLIPSYKTLRQTFCPYGAESSPAIPQTALPTRIGGECL